jgi:hypothetical protein
MALFFLQGKDISSTQHTKPLFEHHNPWTNLVQNPNSMFCAFVRADSEGEARLFAQSVSHTKERVWQDAQWSSCTEVNASMAYLIDSSFEPGIVKMGFVHQFVSPF